MYTRGGYFLAQDPRLLDHAFFGITPLEAATMDPTQRKLLEVVYEALESAGEPWERVSGSRTGVYVGNFNIDHQMMQMRDSDHPLPYASTGGSITLLSNRVSYTFNLQGPR
jgi:acyl transferase domain-containing protein